MLTYHICPVAAAEIPVSVRSFTGAVRTSLVTTIAGAAGVQNLSFKDCGSSNGGGGGHQSADNSCNLHFERVLCCGLKRDVFIEVD